MMNVAFSLVIAVVLGFACPPVFAGLTVLEGEHTVVYDVVNPRGVAFIPDDANESFSQKVVSLDEFSKRVTVTSTMSPMRSRVPFPIARTKIPAAVRQYLDPERDRQSNERQITDLASQITSGSRFTHEAANAVLSWIADNLIFDTSISVPSDALSALKYRKAYCVGYSNLAVALLRAAGIPARVAHGYLPPGYEWGFSKEYWGVKVNDGGFHAYLEIFYPDTGWTFSDAEHSHNFVDPFHIILRIDGLEMSGAYKGGYLDVDKATFYTIFKEDDRTTKVDEHPSPKEKRLGRRMTERQQSALVSGRVLDRSGQAVNKGTVVLWRGGKGTPAAFSNGKFTVAVAESGTYRIDIKGPGYTKSSREIQVESGKNYTVDITLLPGGMIRGTVVDANNRPVKDGDVFYREGSTSYGVSILGDGTYLIEGLAPGQYAVTAIAGDRQATKTVQVETGRESSVHFVLK